MLKSPEKERSRGHARGAAEGELMGTLMGLRKVYATLLKEQLSQKFCRLPENFLWEVGNAELEDLYIWMRRILTAESVADVFGGKNVDDEYC